MKNLMLSLLMLNVSTQTVIGKTDKQVHKIPVEAQVTIHAEDYPGEGVPFVLMHGFPDNKVIYQKLVAELTAGGRRCIVFDFVGWGDSDTPRRRDYPYSVAQQIKELDAVIAHFELYKVTLVVHDMAGPPAIDWVLQHPEMTHELILLNTYYHKTPNRKEPPTITMFSAPVIKHLFLPFARMNFVFRPVFRAQMKPFFRDDEVRAEYMPLFMDQFLDNKNTKSALFKTIGQVPKDVRRNVHQLDRLRSLPTKVKVIFGSSDRYLGKALAEEFATLFPNAELYLLDNCMHYPQIEFPGEVAGIMIGE